MFIKDIIIPEILIKSLQQNWQTILHITGIRQWMTCSSYLKVLNGLLESAMTEHCIFKNTIPVKQLSEHE